MFASANYMLGALLLAATVSAQSTSGDDPGASSSTSTVLLSLAINALIALGMVSAFMILRPRFPQVYRPKTFLGPKEERVEPLPDSLFGWIMPFVKRPTTDIIETNGLDAYMFIAYIEMMIMILGPIFIITWVILLPVYAAGTTGGQVGFQMLTFGQIAGAQVEQNRYAAPLIVVYLVTGWICWCIRKYMLKFIGLRQKFIVSPHHTSSPQSRTLLVTGIPNDYLGERKLKDLYSHLPGGVERVWLHRDLKELPDIFDERTKALNKLESVESKIISTTFKKVKKGKVDENGIEADTKIDRYLTKKERPTMKIGAKLGCIGGQKVDAVDHLRSDIERLNQEIHERQRSESDYEPANAAFLLFRTQVGCHMAAGMIAHHAPYKMSRRYIEAHPNSVIWSNLSMNPYAQKIRTAIFWAATAGLIIAWLPLIAFTAIVSNLSGLCTEVSWLAWLCQIGPATGIIQGFLPTILLAVLNILLPIILRIFAKQSGLPTTTDVELSLMDRMTWFNLLDNFLLFTIISGVSGGISQIVPILSDPSGLPSLISTYIPQANIFYISFIILQALSGSAGGLLQVAKLVIYYIKAFLLGSTPRKVWHIHHDMASPAWGTLFPAIVLVTMITFGYSILAPLINGFAFVAFILFYILYKYLATFVWDIKPWGETSGLFFVKALNASLYGLYLSQLILAVLFLTAQATNADGTTSQSAIPQGVFTIILMVITATFHNLLFDSVGDLTTALPLSLLGPAPAGGYSHGSPRSNDHATLSSARPYPNEKNNGPQSAVGAAPGRQTGVNIMPEQPGYEMNEYNNQRDNTSQTELNPKGQQQSSSGESDENTFRHPALRDPQRTLWFPNDRFGLGSDAVARAREHGLDASNEGTSYNDKNKIVTDVYCPPGEKLL